MGAYVYRLKGTKSYVEEVIQGKPEKVYDLVYWYKPPYSTFWDGDPKWMKPIRMLAARLESIFDKVGYPKYVRLAHEHDNGALERYPDSPILVWRDGLISLSDSSTLWDELYAHKVLPDRLLT